MCGILVGMRIRAATPTLFTAFCFLCATLWPAHVVLSQVADFNAIQQEYDAAAERAMSAIQRKAKLEESLHAAKSKVDKAKEDFDNATKKRLDVRRMLAKKREYADVLKRQMAMLLAQRMMYSGIIDQQRTDLVVFARYVANRDIEMTDTGPVRGGSLLRHVLRGSLGDIIDQDLSHQALLIAREKFFSELSDIMKENTEVESRLIALQQDVEQELAVLSTTYDGLSATSQHAAATVDTSWKQQVLTEKELKEVQAETAEVNEQFLALQEHLVSTDALLREHKVKEMNAEIASLSTERDALLVRKAEITSTIATLKQKNDDQLKAFNAAMQARNSDKNTYKYIEQTKTAISAKQAMIDDVLQTNVPHDQSLPSGAPKDSDSRIAGAFIEIERLRAVLALLTQGIPLAEAEDYVRLKNIWTDAETRLATLTEDLKKVDQSLADLSIKISDLTYAAHRIQNERLNLKAIPSSSFLWPVIGPITAYFFDPTYAKVFGVPHRAIDIAVPQGTPVKAAASGVVYHVKLGGATGYTYVLLGHLNGYASLYGHLSSVSVKEGSIVNAGQIIGYSGGKPGTAGAGKMTTGSHLHFEIMRGSERVDPRTLLP